MKEFLFNMFVSIANAILSLLDVLPDVPEPITNVIDQFFDLIFRGATLVNLIIDINYLSILFSVYIALILFMNGYKLIMWVINKIPVLDVD